MVDVQKVTIQVQVLVFAELHCSIGWLIASDKGARWKQQLGVQAEWWQRDLGQAFGGELMLVYNNLLNVRVGGLLPVGFEGRHGEAII